MAQCSSAPAAALNAAPPSGAPRRVGTTSDVMPAATALRVIFHRPALRYDTLGRRRGGERADVVDALDFDLPGPSHRHEMGDVLRLLGASTLDDQLLDTTRLDGRPDRMDPLDPIADATSSHLVRPRC